MPDEAGGDPAASGARTQACVLAPSPMVTVTLERRNGDSSDDEVHFHAGGQGFWIARLVAELGHHVVLCASFGGEAGLVAEALAATSGLEVRGVRTSGTNGAYIHDRRSGERQELGQMLPTPLTRHEVDELYGTTLVAALESQVCVLGGGWADATPVDAETYGRLTADITGNGGVVVADLSGDHLRAVVEARATVVKVSHEDLLRDEMVEGDDVPALVAALERLVADGAGTVVVTRAEQPALALVEGQVVQVCGPALAPIDHRGAGDSLTAGLAAGMAHGLGTLEALRLGVAAGAINVTRRGLASGRRREIEHLAGTLEVSPLARVG